MISDLWARLRQRSPAAPAPMQDSGAIMHGSMQDKAPSMQDSRPIETDRLPIGSPLARRAAILSAAINPALGWLSLRGLRSDDRARVMLVAITGQEADAQFRRQHGNGPARGLWQFERLGGVAGVLSHRASIRLAEALCEWRGVEASTTAVHAALERDDVLAAGFARLLLWTDPRPLPNDWDAGMLYYLRNWRPGAYTRGDDAERAKLRAKWQDQWRLAREVVTS